MQMLERGWDAADAEKQALAEQRTHLRVVVRLVVASIVRTPTDQGIFIHLFVFQHRHEAADHPEELLTGPPPSGL